MKPDLSRAIADSAAAFSALGNSRVRDDRGRLVIRLALAQAGAQPWVRWNAFVALLSSSAVDELHPSQRSAWHVLRYESEVQNGGHELYFDVCEGVGPDEAVSALAELGAASHAGILGAAIERWKVTQVGTAAARREYDDLDAAFAAAMPSLTAVLETWLDTHADDFVVLA